MSKVVIPVNISPKPSRKEVLAAYLLAEYFSKDVEFVVRGLIQTPDFFIGGCYWELKSPIGNGKRTIQHALHRASKQSVNIVIDARNLKLHIVAVRAQLKHELCHITRIRRLLLIEKSGKVVEITR